MSQPSVLFINRVYPPHRGATGRMLRDLAQSLAEEGWDVRVITTGIKSGKHIDGSVSVSCVKGPKKPNGALGYGWIWLKMLGAAAFQKKADLVITMTDPPLVLFIGHFLKKIKKARHHIHWCQDVYPDVLPVLDFNFPKFLLARFQRFSRKVMSQTDKVVTIGRCMARYLKETGVRPETISLISNWPDFELTDHMPYGQGPGMLNDGTVAQPESGFKHEKKFRVLYAGTIGRAHPVDTILEAADLLQASNPEIEFVFVGEGEGYDSVQKERAHRGLDNIRLLPWQPKAHLRATMESGDIHLVSVKDAASGMLVPCKIYSALAVNRPCIYIGPEDSEAGHLISDFGAGTVVSQGDSYALAEHIRRYRFSSEDWFFAQEGAVSASRTCRPEDMIRLWLDNASAVIESA